MISMGAAVTVEVGCVLGEKRDREKGDYVCFPQLHREHCILFSRHSRIHGVPPSTRALSLPGLPSASYFSNASGISK